MTMDGSAARADVGLASAAAAPVESQAPIAVESEEDRRAFTRVMSTEAGHLFMSESQREVMVMLATPDGKELKLLFAHEQGRTKLDPRIDEYRAVLRRNSVKCEVEAVLGSEIAQYYKDKAGDAGLAKGDSAEQQKVIRIIKEASSRKASDVRISVDGEFCRIRFRENGIEKRYDEVRGEEGMRLVRALFNTMNASKNGNLDISTPQDGHLKKEYADACDLQGSRIATTPLKNNGVMLTMRLLYPEKKEGARLSELGYDPLQEAMLKAMLARKYGIILFTGVVGSGKSTSLVAMVAHYLESNNQEVALITIEDPVEYGMPFEGAFQTPLTYEFGNFEARERAYDEALRNKLRHAMDALVVGEIRDGRGAKTAFDIALSGHLLMSTVHTFDVFSAPKRLIGLGVDPDLVCNPQLVAGVINQSLVRRLCDCKKPYINVREEWLVKYPELVERLEKRVAPELVCVANGCAKCGYSGYTGREVVAEVLKPNLDLMTTMTTKGMVRARQQWVTQYRGMTKMAHAIKKIAMGMVDPRHVEKDVGLLTVDEEELGLEPEFIGTDPRHAPKAATAASAKPVQPTPPPMSVKSNVADATRASIPSTSFLQSSMTDVNLRLS